MRIRFDLYMQTGKWKYGGFSEIPDGCDIHDKNILEVIEKNQTEVVPSTIVDRNLHCVVSLDDTVDQNANTFFKHLFVALPEEHWDGEAEMGDNDGNQALLND